MSGDPLLDYLVLVEGNKETGRSSAGCFPQLIIFFYLSWFVGR